jgi:hypothetical protein
VSNVTTRRLECIIDCRVDYIGAERTGRTARYSDAYKGFPHSRIRTPIDFNDTCSGVRKRLRTNEPRNSWQRHRLPDILAFGRNNDQRRCTRRGEKFEERGRDGVAERSFRITARARAMRRSRARNVLND